MNTQCPLDTHDSQKIKYLCVDTKCSFPQKIGCADCFLENHLTTLTESHQRMPISKFEQEITEKVEAVKNIDIEPISRDSQQFDSDFNICLQQITLKFTQFKEDLRKEVESDAEKFDAAVEGFKTSMNEIIEPVQQIANNKLLDLSAEDLGRAIQFYQNSEQVSDQIKKKIQNIEQTREKVNQKKQKITNKLYNAVDSILRELDDFIKDDSKGKRLSFAEGTPEKQQNQHSSAIFLSGSSQETTKPIKNLIEEARSKRFPINQKSIMKKQKS